MPEPGIRIVRGNDVIVVPGAIPVLRGFVDVVNDLFDSFNGTETATRTAPAHGQRQAAAGPSAAPDGPAPSGYGVGPQPMRVRLADNESETKR